MALAGVLLHGFGPRYDLPIAEWLFLYGAGGVVAISFVLVVVFAGDKVGSKAIAYPRRAVPALVGVANAAWPRVAGGVIGVVGLLAVVVCGLFGSTRPELNPGEYVTWIFFWAATVILSGLVGNLWYLLNPWAAIFDAVLRRTRPVARLPQVGVWPAAALYVAFVGLELTSGMANRPWIVATAAIAYSVLTLAGMAVFGRDAWLEHCEAFTVLFRIIERFAPWEAERDGAGRATMVYVRPWGVGLLKPYPAGWDRVVFVILMLSSLAFDGIINTPAWQDFAVALEPVWLPMGAFGFFFVRTFGLLLLSVTFFLVFVAVMQAVIYFGRRKVDLVATVSAFALTLVPIALVYNAAHNYGYMTVNAQYFIPLLSDPLQRGWQLFPALASYKLNYGLDQFSTIWYTQIVLIVLGHVIAVYLSHLRAGERFRSAQRALLSQYPMLILMIGYTMVSLSILAAPSNPGG